MDVGKNDDSDSDATFWDLVLDSSDTNKRNVDFEEFSDESNILEDFQTEAHQKLHETGQLPANDNNLGYVDKLGVAALCETENNSHSFSLGTQYEQMQETWNINSDSDCEDAIIVKHGEINDQRMNDGDVDTNDSDSVGSKFDPEVDAIERTFSLCMKIECSECLNALSNSPMKQYEKFRLVKLGKTNYNNGETVCNNDRESNMDGKDESQSLLETEQHLATTIRKRCNNCTTEDIKYSVLHNNQLPRDDREERQKRCNETADQLLFENDGDVEEELSSLPHDLLPLKRYQSHLQQREKQNKDRANETDDSLQYQTIVEKGVSLQCSEPVVLYEGQQNTEAEDTMAIVQIYQNLLSSSTERSADKILKKHFLQKDRIAKKNVSNAETFRKTLCPRKQQLPYDETTQSLTPLKDHANEQQSVPKSGPFFNWTIQTRANASKDCNQHFQGKSLRKSNKGTKCVKRLKCDSDSDVDSPSSVDEDCRRSKRKQVTRLKLTNSKKGLPELELEQVNKNYSELQEMNEKVSGWLKGWGETLSREAALRTLDDARRIVHHSKQLNHTFNENFKLQEVLQISESLELILDVAIKECDSVQLIEEQELASLVTEKDEVILKSDEPIRNDKTEDCGNSSSKTEELRKSPGGGRYERSSSEITDNLSKPLLEITKDRPVQTDREQTTHFTGLKDVLCNHVEVPLKSIMRVASRQDTIKKHVQLDLPIIYYEPIASDECLERDSGLNTEMQNPPLLIEEQINAIVPQRLIEHDAQIDYKASCSMSQDNYIDGNRMNDLPNETPRSTQDESPSSSLNGSDVELSKAFLCNRQTVVSVQTQLKENSKLISEQGCVHHSPTASLVEEAHSVQRSHNKPQVTSTKLIIHTTNQKIKNSQLFFKFTGQECVSDSPTDFNESVELHSEDYTQYSPADKSSAMLTKDQCETKCAIENIINKKTQSVLGVESQKYVQPCQPKSKKNVEPFSEEDCTQYSSANSFLGIESTTQGQSEMQGSFKVDKKQLNALKKPQPVYGYMRQNYVHKPQLKANVILTSEENFIKYDNVATKSTSHITDIHLPAIRDSNLGEKSISMAHITDTEGDALQIASLSARVEPLRGDDAGLSSVSVERTAKKYLPATVKPMRDTSAIKKQSRRVKISLASRKRCTSNPALVSVLSKDLADEQKTETKSRGVLRKASIRVFKDNLLGKKVLENRNMAALSPSSKGVLCKEDNRACNKPGDKCAMENMQTIDSLDISFDLFTTNPVECNESQQEMDLCLPDVEIASNVSITGITQIRVKSPGEFMPTSDMPEGFWEGKSSVAINDWFKNMELW